MPKNNPSRRNGYDHREKDRNSPSWPIRYSGQRCIECSLYVPFCFFRFFWFTTALKSNQIFVTPPQINFLMKKYWMNALHFFSLELILSPSLWHGVYTYYLFILPFKRDYETNFVMPRLVIVQMETPRIALQIPAFTIALLAFVLVGIRHYGTRLKVFHTLKLWFAKPWGSVLLSMEPFVLQQRIPTSPSPVQLPCQLERSFVETSVWRFEKGATYTSL